MKVTLYTGAVGINNKIISHRLPFDAETGVSALEKAKDVLLDQTGELATRRGTKLLEAGSFHSAYLVPDGFYVVKVRANDSAIYKAVVSSTGGISLYGIRSGLERNARMDFLKIDNEVLYCNGSQNGKITDDVSDDWPENIWPGPDTEADMTQLPIGEHIDLLSGRVILSIGRDLFFSEYGLPGIMDAVKNRRRFENDIIMILAVGSGVYISTTKAVYFLAGKNPHKWIPEKVLNYPAIEWGVNQELVNPSILGIEAYKLSGLFATVNGPVVGLPDGTAINLTEKNLKLPDGCGAHSGSIMVINETIIMQSGE